MLALMTGGVGRPDENSLVRFSTGQLSGADLGSIEPTAPRPGPEQVLAIDRRGFLDLLGDRPELLRGGFRVMSKQLKSMVLDLAQARHATGEVPRQG